MVHGKGTIRHPLRRTLHKGDGLIFNQARPYTKFLTVPILGEDCGFETFGALKRAEEREFDKKFLSRDMIVETWRTLPVPVETHRPTIIEAPPIILSLPTPTRPPRPLPDLRSVGDGDWATPNGLSQEAIVLFAMIDVLRRLDGPTPWERVHMAVTLARKPALALPFFDDHRRADWQRVIGKETEPLPANVVSLAHFQQNRSDRAWADVESRLLGTGVLIIHNDTGLWEAGTNLPSSEEPWMEGRAAWAVHLLASIATAAAAQNIVSFISKVEGGGAARNVS